MKWQTQLMVTTEDSPLRARILFFEGRAWDKAEYDWLVYDFSKDEDQQNLAKGKCATLDDAKAACEAAIDKAKARR